MKKIGALVIIYCVTFSSASGQLKNLILTREQNNTWMDSVKRLSFDQQLLNINYRLLADTNVYVRQFYNGRIQSNYTIADSLGNRKHGDGKPMIVIGGSLLFIDNKTVTNKIIRLTALINKNNIKEIFFLTPNDPATTAVYGYEGRSGVIIMTLIKKKYFKKICSFKIKVELLIPNSRVCYFYSNRFVSS